MRSLIITIAMFMCVVAQAQMTAAPFESHLRWSMGAAMETRMQREVNTDYAQLRSSAQLFVQARFIPSAWMAQLEFSRAEERSQLGALHIGVTTTNIGGWGRYEFNRERRWHPFLASGSGVYLDHVATRFGSSLDERNAWRGFWGMGAGASALYFGSLVLELEGRALLVEDRAEPIFTGLFRLGLQI